MLRNNELEKAKLKTLGMNYNFPPVEMFSTITGKAALMFRLVEHEMRPGTRLSLPIF